MTWTNEKPTAPGWYWYRYKQGAKPEPVRLEIDDEGKREFDFGGYDSDWVYEELNGQFAGPIPEPEEPRILPANVIPAPAVTLFKDLPGYIRNPRGHAWKLDDSGKVDVMAYDVEDSESFGGHNGPACVKCGYAYCEHCLPDGPFEDCPKA